MDETASQPPMDLDRRRFAGWIRVGGMYYARKARRCGSFIAAFEQRLDRLVASDDWRKWWIGNAAINHLTIEFIFESDPPSVDVRPGIYRRRDDLVVRHCYHPAQWAALEATSAQAELQAILGHVITKRKLPPPPDGQFAGRKMPEA